MTYTLLGTSLNCIPGPTGVHGGTGRIQWMRGTCHGVTSHGYGRGLPLMGPSSVYLTQDEELATLAPTDVVFILLQC